ncbi:MAG: V-type H+-transporting ATPase subunit D [archaeon GW2011_AR3]|nr:MAG: V-type H+-transporting ATPase subunit D [archaeon GW2011_AR3]MBS3109374.1 V-type ATP synthase subunit D [Candidatus Woesearchaeota archaeon]
MAQDIKPTRSELMKLKKKIKLAKSGYNLLKKKRDGLILDFFEVLGKAKTLRSEMTNFYNGAQNRMNIARMLESDLAIKSIALAMKNRPEIDLKTKSIMGVKVPKINQLDLQKKNSERGPGIFNSAAVTETAEAYEKLVEKVIVAAEVETSMRKLLQEIEKTKRRVNALEFAVIPQMQKSANFIRLRLEEMERENIFRMKRIKKKNEAAA